MSSENLLSLWFPLLMSLLIASGIHSKNRPNQFYPEPNVIHRPSVSGLIFPICLLALMCSAFLLSDMHTAIRTVLRISFSVLPQLSVYYLLLILVIPLLRRLISTKACALLWLLPGFLYIMMNVNLTRSEPALVIFVPSKTLWPLFWIWLIGFILIFTWMVISHLRFRTRLLSEAHEVTAPDILDLWYRMQNFADIPEKSRYPLFISPLSKTPLSIGLFQKSTRVILPQRDYSLQDLELILRHELIHITRKDASTKFLLAFCRAFCWFNPLMWIAMRQSADDLELSCDEAVLLQENDASRKRYAELILQTSGDEKGFTTCLSVEAKSLRYRLKNILKPGKRFSGGLIVGLSMFILLSSGGQVSFAYDDGAGAERLFAGGNHSKYEINAINCYAPTLADDCTCTDPEALFDYLSDLPLYQLTGMHSLPEMEYRLRISLTGPDGKILLQISENKIVLVPSADSDQSTKTYYVGNVIDFAYLTSLMEPIDESEIPDLPIMVITYNKPNGTKKSVTCPGNIAPDEDFGDYFISEATPLELSLSLPGEIWLDFPETPYNEEIRVREKPEGSGITVSHEYSHASLEYLSHIMLEDKLTHYTIFASYPNADGELIDVAYYFDVLPLED